MARSLHACIKLHVARLRLVELAIILQGAVIWEDTICAVVRLVVAIGAAFLFGNLFVECLFGFSIVRIQEHKACLDHVGPLCVVLLSLVDEDGDRNDEN